MQLESLVFQTDTTELERASKAIAALVQDMSQVSASTAQMAKVSAQTEAILARAAKDYAKARKENARAAEVESRTTIAANKADEERAERIRRSTEATEESTRASGRNVTILQRQSDILEFQAQGWSKGQSSILATAKAANIAADEMEKLQKVLETQRKLMGSDPFDKSMSGLTSLKNQYGELRESIRQYNTDSDLTSKQTKELARDKERLIEKMKTESASFSEIRAAVRAHNDEYVKLAGQYNNLANAEANVLKNRKAVASATEYLTSADQKLAAALNTSNAAIDRSGTDLLVKYEAALRKSGVAQDVATQKLAAYKAQLVQVQGQEQKRREDHLTRSIAPQATDIAVSLWSGQNPLTVLLQQGGQISDMFMLSGVAAEDFSKVVRASLASMVPAMMTVATGIAEVLGGMFVDAGKSVLDFISDVSGISAAVEQAQRWIVSAGEANFRWIGVMQRFGETATKVMAVGILALVTAMVAIAMKYKEIIQSENELSKALALNGGAMDMTKESAIAYADSMKQVGIGNLKAQESMTAFINAGAVGAETMDAAREAAVALEKYAGIALSDTAKEFAKLQDEPSKGLIEIAKNTGQVEKATLDVISALEKEQGASAAAAAATVYAADAKKKAADEIKARLSPIETLWHDIKSAIGQVGQAIYDLSKSEETVKVLRTIWQAFAVSVAETWYVLKQTGITIGAIAAGYSVLFTDGVAAARAVGADMKVQAEEARVSHDKLIASIMTKGDVEEKQFTKKKAQNSEYAAWLEKNSKALAKSQSNEEQFATKKKELQADLKKGLIDEVKYNEALAGWKRVIMGEDKKAPKGDKKLDSFYDDAMKKFRDATIEANDATNELTKSQVTLMEKMADPKFAKLSEQKKLDILQSGAAAIAIEKQKEATIALTKAEEFREKVLGKSEGLGAQYYAQIEALHKHAEATNWSTEQIDEQIRMIYKGTPVYQNYQKALDAAANAAAKYNGEIENSVTASDSELANLDLRISALGKTEVEQRALTLAYEKNRKEITATIATNKTLLNIEKDIKKARDSGLKDTDKEMADLLLAKTNAYAAGVRAQEVIDKEYDTKRREEADKEIQAIKRGLSDSIVTALFEGGKEGSKKLRSVLVDTLRKRVTIFVDAVVNTLFGGAVSSILGGSAGGGDLVGTASNVGSAYRAASGFNTGWLTNFGATMPGSIASTGANLYSQGFETVGSSMMDFGNSIAGYADAINVAGDVLGYGAAIFAAANGKWGQAIGSAVGTYFGGPIGSFIGSTIGKWADKIFSGGAGTPHSGGGLIYSAENGIRGGAENYNKATFGMGVAQEYNPEVEKLIGPLAIGMVTTFDGIAKTFGKTAGYEIATAFADDTDKDGAWGSLRISKDGSDLLNWEDTRKSKWAPKEFADGEAGYKEYLAAIAKDTRQVLLDMDLPSWADTLLESIGDAADMDALSQAVAQIGAIQTTFVQLGQTIDGFAGMGDKAFEALMKASGGFEALAQNAGSYYENFYTEAERMGKATEVLAAELAKAGVEMPATKDAYRARVTEQLNAGEAGQALAAKLLQLSPAFAEVTEYAEEARIALQGDLADAYKTEVSRLEDLVSTYAKAGDALAKFKEQLAFSNLSTSTPMQKYEKASIDYNVLYQKALGGDTQAATDFGTYATKFLELSRGAYASGEEYTSDYTRVNSDLDRITSITETKTSETKDMLDMAKSQVGYLASIDTEVKSLSMVIQEYSQTLIASNASKDVGSVLQAYSDVGRTGFGTEVNQIDITGFDYWLKDIQMNGLEGFQQRFDKTVANYLAEKDDIYGRYVQGNLTGEVPAFANGGMHNGGIRLVGEKGPELEVTGPARYISNSKLPSLLPQSIPQDSQQDNSDIVEQLAIITAKLGKLQEELVIAVVEGSLMNTRATEQNTQVLGKAVKEAASKQAHATKLKEKASVYDR